MDQELHPHLEPLTISLLGPASFKVEIGGAASVRMAIEPNWSIPKNRNMAEIIGSGDTD